MSLEVYAKARREFRERVLAHKKPRTVHLGEHVTLLFEDELTMRYQVQEMLRAEKIFEERGIQDEIDAYNPLIPDGRNFKATMMIEYEDERERRAALAKMKGIEDETWIRVESLPRVYRPYAIRSSVSGCSRRALRATPDSSMPCSIRRAAIGQSEVT